MIPQLLKALEKAPKHKSELIDFAKGKYKYPSNFKELIKYIKWQLKR